ncbi:hypothetical protein [Pelomonas sp. KK5]|uniref:BPSS1187 family protein n=1 Tax=Pelomonas sp. KK5 TaxID=1855730 RepID=UPI001301AEE2|nr:hypothetical protein [Pelomonas sp. KK5]
MRRIRKAALAAFFVLAAVALPCGAVEHLLVPPHDTDERLGVNEPPHLVVYDRDAAGTPPLLIWLAGTNGHPSTGPQKFFATAVDQGYRLIGISYFSEPAVSQVCTQRRVREQPRCAEAFRQQRVWGDQTGIVQDRPEDAIVPRLAQLLRHLQKSDPAGDWGRYLDGDEPRWALITAAGQSQGGGMAAYLAKSRKLAGVIMFSGGWDHGRDGIAAWYRRDSATPAERWSGTYHVDENQAGTMDQIYRTLGLPPSHIHALNLPVMPGHLPHGEGISNIAYQPLWREMLGTVSL